MNVAYYQLARFDTPDLIYKSELHFDLYYEMFALSMRSLLKHLGGLWTIFVRAGAVASWTELGRRAFDDIRRLTAEGHNVMLIGADCLLVQPLDFKWDLGQMRLWALAGGGCAPNGREVLPWYAYYNSGQAFFPAGLSDHLWRVGESAFRYETTTHELDQLAYSLMYLAQGPTEDPQIGMNSFAAEPIPADLPPDLYFRHYHATRGPREALAMMRADAARFCT